MYGIDNPFMTTTNDDARHRYVQLVVFAYCLKLPWIMNGVNAITRLSKRRKWST